MASPFTPDSFAVYFPSFHPDRHYAQWYGPGFSEWDLVRNARPLFPGHHQPYRCTWGCFDESDPAWMARQIDLAADHGLTGFMFDWYWYDGDPFLEAALERGFLNAPNRQRLQFFVMWANHTWGVWPAMRERYRGRPAGASRSEGQALAYDGTLLPIRHSFADMARVADLCCERYFRQPNYYRIDGKPVFAIWYPVEIERQLGGKAGVARTIELFRERARAAGLPGVHLTFNIANIEPGILCWRPESIAWLQEAGADSVFGYNISRTEGYAALRDEWPVVAYDDVLASHRTLFGLCANRGLPFHPVATTGFDNTARWHPGARLPVDFRRLGYEPIVADSTPAKFGGLVRDALACCHAQAPAHPFLLVNAWNEWTEGCYLLPEERHGTGYLEALRDALRDTRASPA